MRNGFLCAAFMLFLTASSLGADCKSLPTASQLRQFLGTAALTGGDAGGLFHGTLMWAAVVNRDGTTCAFAASTSDASQVWPGSQAIAKAKAYTANAFSNDSTPLSTARLYTLVQPGHSLWSLGQSNPFNPFFLSAPGSQRGTNQIAGGMIFFGGGVPLYSSGKVIGGLGISGDTSCTDHEIAKRVRTLAGLDPTGGPSKDDILYPIDGPSVFMHPFCVNTFRNGSHVGEETPATTY